MTCKCDLNSFDLTGEIPRQPCKEFRPNNPGDIHCGWCEHKEECHKEEDHD